MLLKILQMKGDTKIAGGILKSIKEFGIAQVVFGDLLNCDSACGKIERFFHVGGPMTVGFEKLRPMFPLDQNFHIYALCPWLRNDRRIGRVDAESMQSYSPTHGKRKGDFCRGVVFRYSYNTYIGHPTDKKSWVGYVGVMQSNKDLSNGMFFDRQGATKEASNLLEQANQGASSAMENLARIQGDAFDVSAARDLYPLFKVYILFSNLEEPERDILIHLYQTRSDIKQLVRRDSAVVHSQELAETETRFISLRDRVNAAGIPKKLSAVQRVILESEFFRADTQSLTE